MNGSRARLGSVLGALVVLAACGSPTTPAALSPSGATAPASGGAVASGAPAIASPLSPGLQTLIDGAREEGQLTLVWSESTAGGETGARRLAEGFNRLYGLNVDVRFRRALRCPKWLLRWPRRPRPGARPRPTS